MSLDTIEKAILDKIYSKFVNCPERPAEIPGITAADAFDANDCMGTVYKLHVPFSGVIYSATFFDLDDEGTQVDLMVFNHEITQIASDAAWAPGDDDILKLQTMLSFVTFSDHGGCRTSELTNIGKAYTAPEGYLWIQAVTRSTPTIAVGNMPHFQIQISPDDPNWIG